MSVVDSALEQIKQLKPYSPGKPVEELERELGISNAIKLASNENPLGCSPKVQSALNQTGDQTALYPDANAYYLKQALAEKLSLNSNQITIGNGSNDVLDLIARTFLEGGREAIFSEFSFMVYGLVTQACGATARIAKANGADTPQPHGHDLATMLALISENTRLIFLANPNNPTGTWLNREALGSFIKQVPSEIPIVIDEAYFEYVEDNQYPDALAWLAEHPNLIVTRTFSKIFGLAGLRVGYAVSSPAISDLLNRVRQPFNASSTALAAALVALNDGEFIAQSKQMNRLGLEKMQRWFAARDISFIPSVGNFLSVDFGDKSERINQALQQRGIIVRPLANYGLPQFLRITVGTESQIDRLFLALDDLID